MGGASMINIIATVDNNNRIGTSLGETPWQVTPEMLQVFSDYTKNKTIIMGRGLYDSMGLLGSRDTIILSRSLKRRGLRVVKNLQEVSRMRKDIWVVGGEKTFTSLLPMSDTIILLRLPEEYKEATRRFPKISSKFEMVSSKAHSGFSVETYKNLA